MFIPKDAGANTQALKATAAAPKKKTAFRAARRGSIDGSLPKPMGVMLATVASDKQAPSDKRIARNIRRNSLDRDDAHQAASAVKAVEATKEEGGDAAGKPKPSVFDAVNDRELKDIRDAFNFYDTGALGGSMNGAGAHTVIQQSSM